MDRPGEELTRSRGRRRAGAALALGTVAVLAGCNERSESPRQAPVATRPAPLIVGDDDRCELLEGGAHTGEALTTYLAHSVPALVASGFLTQSGNTWTLATTTGFNWCPGVRYREQRQAAECTAALVGDDLIVTAKHCVEDASMGGNLLPIRKVLFGFYVDVAAGATQGRTTFANDEVYSMTSVVASSSGGADWAIVRLDRPAHRRYRRLRMAQHDPVFSTNPAVATSLYMVGYGLGKPAKTSLVGHAILDTHPAFRAVIEGFSGNSGSPVFDRSTHEIMGVLSSGDEDKVWDANARCFRPFVCPHQTCNMTIQKGSLFRHLIPSPPGSCAGACGASADGCFCDEVCQQFNDCCPDKAQVCPASPARACDNQCGGQSGSGCWCDPSCPMFGDCCSGYYQSCGAVRF